MCLPSANGPAGAWSGVATAEDIALVCVVSCSRRLAQAWDECGDGDPGRDVKPLEASPLDENLQRNMNAGG